MERRTPKHLVEAHGLICGPSRLKKKAHGKAEYRHLEHVRKIFEDRNIVALGIADKRTEKCATGELCLRFYVKKKLAKSKMKGGIMIPPVIGIAGRNPVFTDVHATGRIVAQENVKENEIESGFSVSHISGPGAGTVGAIVRNGTTNYILSNSHVLARSGQASKGDKIIYPGIFDGKKQHVASLTDFVVLDTASEFEADAALAKIDGSVALPIDFAIFDARSPVKTIEPARGMTISMSGRQSGDRPRISVVDDIHCKPVLFINNFGNVMFKMQVSCPRYSDEGDSGALIVDSGSGAITGLHIGASDKDSFFSPISAVMRALSPSFEFVNFP